MSLGDAVRAMIADSPVFPFLCYWPVSCPFPTTEPPLFGLCVLNTLETNPLVLADSGMISLALDFFKAFSGVFECVKLLGR